MQILAIFTGLLGMLIGAIIGHRLTIGRDKRKEFNDATQGVREEIRIQISNPDGNIYLSLEQLDPLSEYFSGRQKNKYDKAVANYREVLSTGTYVDDMGCIIVQNNPKRYSALKVIQPLLARK